MNPPVDPELLARYRAELRHAAAGPRNLGIAFALLGTIAAVVRMMWLPRLPELVPVTLIVVALGLMLLGIVRRTRYHLQYIRRL